MIRKQRLGSSYMFYFLLKTYLFFLYQLTRAQLWMSVPEAKEFLLPVHMRLHWLLSVFTAVSPEPLSGS